MKAQREVSISNHNRKIAQFLYKVVRFPIFVNSTIHGFRLISILSHVYAFKRPTVTLLSFGFFTLQTDIVNCDSCPATGQLPAIERHLEPVGSIDYTVHWSFPSPSRGSSPSIHLCANVINELFSNVFINSFPLFIVTYNIVLRWNRHTLVPILAFSSLLKV